ncbi:hypothetical protein JHK86_005902 [Glycine max]|uniref:Uncharacterized protein n=1 Tax=Glycine max TaxID=3847 RepID=I1JJV4_SOYBN|nr:hypothetical protein JHK86_005902 [Glycine max]
MQKLGWEFVRQGFEIAKEKDDEINPTLLKKQTNFVFSTSAYGNPSFIAITIPPSMLIAIVPVSSLAVRLPQHEGNFSLEPELPVISTEDLPWLVGTDAARKARFKFWKRTLVRSSALKWLLVNSFPDESKLESANNKNKFKGCPRVFPIGPICNCRIDGELLGRRYELLEVASKAEGEVSWASGRPFIWVLRSTWRQGLPVGFLERVMKQQGRGMTMVVSWAPQNQILQHNSVALLYHSLRLEFHIGGFTVPKEIALLPGGLKLNIGLEPKDVEEALVRFIQDKEMDTRLRIFNQRIMGGNNNKTGTLMLKTFLQDLNKARHNFNF